MTAAEFFVLYGIVKDQYRDTLEQTAEIRAAATKTTSACDGIVVGGSRDQHKDDVLIRYAEQNKYHRRVTERKRRMNHAFVSLLKSIDDTMYREILYLRIGRGLTWSKLTTKLSEHVCERTVYRRYRSAVEEAERKWKELGYDNIDW